MTNDMMFLFVMVASYFVLTLFGMFVPFLGN